MGGCCAVLRGSSVSDPAQTQAQEQRRQQGAFQGQGHRLGGGAAPATAEDRRAAQERAVEARKAQWDARAGVKGSKNAAPSGGTSASSSTRAPQPVSEPSRQQGNAGINTPGAAAERRAQQSGMPGISSEKAEAMRQRQIKDDLLGRIEHFYKQAGQDVPFGLASCSVEQLRKHLDHAKSLTRGGGAGSKAMTTS